MNQQNAIPPTAHCSSTVAASRRITARRVTAYAGGAMPAKHPPAVALAVRMAAITVAGALLLTACVTGERPSFVDEDAAAGTPVGDASVDAVLSRLENPTTTAVHRRLHDPHQGHGRHIQRHRGRRRRPQVDHDLQHPVPHRGLTYRHVQHELRALHATRSTMAGSATSR